MPRSSRAMLLDLDDTLYPHRRFRLSGFAAVARHAERFHGVPARDVFRYLVRASRGPEAGRELQVVSAAFGMRATLGEFIRIYRGHTPSIRLSPSTLSTIKRLRRSWRLAIVTNGIPAIQANKVAALGLERWVDTVVYASEWGTGEGKPDREPFFVALHRLGVAPSHALFVGDDTFCDVFGAMRCGLRTIQTREWKRGATTAPCLGADAVVDSFAEVPDLASDILPRRIARHAA